MVHTPSSAPKGMNAEIILPEFPDKKFPQFGLRIRTKNGGEISKNRMNELLYGDEDAVFKDLIEQYGFLIFHGVQDVDKFTGQVRNTFPRPEEWHQDPVDEKMADDILALYHPVEGIRRPTKTLVTGKTPLSQAVLKSKEFIQDRTQSNAEIESLFETHKKGAEYDPQKKLDWFLNNSILGKLKNSDRNIYDHVSNSIDPILREQRALFEQVWNYGDLMAMSMILPHKRLALGKDAPPDTSVLRRTTIPR